MVNKQRIDPALVITDSLYFSIRMLLSTNSEPLLKQVLWCILTLTRASVDRLFTFKHFSAYVIDLIIPIAEEKVLLNIQWIHLFSILCSIPWTIYRTFFLMRNHWLLISLCQKSLEVLKEHMPLLGLFWVGFPAMKQDWVDPELRTRIVFWWN